MNKFDLANFLIANLIDNNIIRVSGYPACGKTTLSKVIKEKLTDCIIIEAEHWIYPLQYRIDRKISGSNPKSYDIKKCITDLKRLLIDFSITVNEYSHEAGDFIQQQKLIIKGTSTIVLDGTIFSRPEFDIFSDTCVFIIPEDQDVWMNYSVKRDLTERYFSYGHALLHNRNKLLDLQEFYQHNCQQIKCLHKDDFEYFLDEYRV